MLSLRLFASKFNCLSTKTTGFMAEASCERYRDSTWRYPSLFGNNLERHQITKIYLYYILLYIYIFFVRPGTRVVRDLRPAWVTSMDTIVMALSLQR